MARARDELETRVAERTDQLVRLIHQLRKGARERRELERYTKVHNAILRLFLEATSQEEYLSSAARLLHQSLGCRCLGIRARNEKGNIPYVWHEGFSPEFLATENSLSLEQDQCACIRIIAGRVEPQDAPAITPVGSFCCNDIDQFVSHLTAEQNSRFRGACIRAGFKTVGIVPIRYGSRAIGAIHVADERKGALPPAKLRLVESVAPLIGEGLYRFDVEAELRALSRRLVEIQEDERRVIARDLHDQIGQSITMLSISIERALRSSPDKMHSILDETKVLVKELMEQVREMSLNLRPSILDDLGLLAALTWHFQRFTSQTNIDVKFEQRGLDIELPWDIRTTVYRIIQEALNNVARYAGVSEVTVRAWVTDETLSIQVEDHGKGFDPGEVSLASSGIRGMQERASLVGGNLAVDSVPGAGTSVMAELPLPQGPPQAN